MTSGMVYREIISQKDEFHVKNKIGDKLKEFLSNTEKSKLIIK